VLDALLHDVRYAIRWLRRSPGVTLVAVASLAVGIGFNTALFGVVDALLFRALPVHAPERLVDVYTSGSDGDTYATSSYPDFLDFRTHNDVFSDMMAYSPMFAALNLPDRSRLVLGEVVTGNYFQVLGVGTALGRALMPADAEPGAERVAMIAHRHWLREYGAAPDVVGRTLRLRGQSYTIVGVTPPGFTGMVPMLAPETWIPISHVMEVEPAGIQDAVPSPTGTTRLDRRGQRWLFVKGRLRPGATLEQAGANLEVLMARLTAEHPQTNEHRRVSVKATRDVRIHPEADGPLRFAGLGLMLAVGLVLIVACANVASMLLARAASRQREISIRLALGAGRGRLMRQLLTESVLLALIGAGAGLVLAVWLINLAGAVTLPLPVPLTLDLRLDARVLAFTIIISLLAGLMAGLMPALKASSRNLVGDLRGEGAGAEVAGRRWTLRDGLVGAQMAITVVLLVVAGLLTRSLMAAGHADPGFRVDRLVVVSADLDMLRYDRQEGRQFWERAVERIGTMPGTEAVALASRVPFSINFGQDNIFVPGHHAPGDRVPAILSARVSEDYFRALGISILEGRSFSAADTPDTPEVVIISETMAARYWPGESPIGRRIHRRGPDGPAYEIVGVAADHRVRTMGETPQPVVHFAQSQQPGSYQVLLARTRGEAGAALAQIRRELLALEPNLVFIDSQTMEEQVAATLFPARAAAWIVSIVGLVAMLLAAIGLYGVVAYSVARRTREIGIRMALGAQPSNVLALVLRQGLAVAGAGLLAGCVLAGGAARVIGGWLYGVGAADPLAWIAAAATVMGVATLANLLPARRAARVAPWMALRTD
jgi:macrolide transport system ATP-binding/permease protein